MTDKNYVKALRRAKAKKMYYQSIFLFVPVGFILFILNVTLIAPHAPWCLIPIGFMTLALLIQKLLLFKKPTKTVFASDYLEYQTEKELRMIEFDDDMDELEAEKLQLRQLELQPLSKGDRELV